MTALLLVPAFVSALVLGAHFLRAGHLVLVGLCLTGATLVFVKRPWAALVLQAGLILGALEWIRTAVELVSTRQAAGLAHTRLALILGSVAALTGLSALAFSTLRLRERFGRHA